MARALDRTRHEYLELLLEPAHTLDDTDLDSLLNIVDALVAKSRVKTSLAASAKRWELAPHSRTARRRAPTAGARPRRRARN